MAANLDQRLIDHLIDQAERLAAGRRPTMPKALYAQLEHELGLVRVTLRHWAQSRSEQSAERLEAWDEAHLSLFGLQAEWLRYQVERGHDWARRLHAALLAEIAALVESGTLSAPELVKLLRALRDARLDAGTELPALLERRMQAAAPPLTDAPKDLAAAFRETIAEFDAALAGADAFAAQQLFDEMSGGYPPAVRLALAQALFDSGHPLLGAAIPLLCLDRDPRLRQGIPPLLAAHPAALSGDDLRRLIALRNWLPETERPAIDRVIKAARRAGVECAAWPAPQPHRLFAAPIDGSAAQGICLTIDTPRRNRFATVLLRLGQGVIDAWASPVCRKAEVKQMLEMAVEQSRAQPVSRAFLDRAVCHHLADAVAPPPPGLLQVAELVGATDWLPAALELQTLAGTAVAQLRLAPPSDEERQQILEGSDVWSRVHSITNSWFEDDQTVDDLLGDLDPETDPAAEVLARLIEPHRERWAALALWAAHWLLEGGDDERLIAANYLVLADALMGGHPLADIGLMWQIADLTLAAAGERLAGQPG